MAPGRELHSVELVSGALGILKEEGVLSDRRFSLYDETKLWILLAGLLPKFRLDRYLVLQNPRSILRNVTRFLSRSDDEMIDEIGDAVGNDACLAGAGTA